MENRIESAATVNRRLCNLSSEQWSKINDIIPDIYLETDIHRFRERFLEKLQELIPHEKSFFDLGYKKNNKVVFFDPVSNNMEQQYLDSYFSEYESIDIMFWFFSQNRRNIYRESDYITAAMMDSSVIYNEWMKPQGIRYSMGSKVVENDILFGSVNLWRGDKHGDFTDEELTVLEILNEHLSKHFFNRYPNGINRTSENEYSDTLKHLYNLTGRESEIVEQIDRGLTSREIAENLFISENTVKKHTYNIFKKMKVSNRYQVIKIVHGFSTTSVEKLSEEKMEQLNESQGKML